MNGDRNATIRCRRWHYRNVNEIAREIGEDAKRCGSLHAALVRHLAVRGDRLPEGLTPEKAVDMILKTTDGFVAARDMAKTPEDIRAEIVRSVSAMDQRQALSYLSVLEITFRMCDISAIGQKPIKDAETLAREVTESVAGASAEDIAGRIDQLAESICGDSLQAFVFATGAAEMKTILFAENPSDEGLSMAAAERIHAALTDAQERGTVYATVATASYGMLLDGKIDGVDATAMNPGVMTALVVVGLEKASILTRLARGEIDRELAMELLSRLGRALKWALVVTMKATLVIMPTVASLILPVTFVSLAPFAGIFVAIGLLSGIASAAALEDDIEDIADVVGEFVGYGIECVASAATWAWGGIRNMARAVCGRVEVAAS